MALRDNLAAKLLLDHTSQLVWEDLVTVAQNLTQQERDQLVQLLITDHKAAGKALRDRLVSIAKQRALTEADQMLSDGALDTTELNRLFSEV